jgi:hypothetical protein
LFNYPQRLEIPNKVFAASYKEVATPLKSLKTLNFKINNYFLVIGWMSKICLWDLTKNTFTLGSITTFSLPLIFFTFVSWILEVLL